MSVVHYPGRLAAEYTVVPPGMSLCPQCSWKHCEHKVWPHGLPDSRFEDTTLCSPSEAQQAGKSFSERAEA